MRDDRLRVFVSSKMAELAAERAAIREVLDEFNIDAWVFEQDAGARPETIEETYKEQLRAADLYIGVFWKGYGEYTIDEFELARATDTDCLIYQKQGAKAEGRDPRLEAFLDRIGKVESGLTVQFFDTPEELREMVKRDTARWQTRIVRKYREGVPRRGAGPPADPDLVVLRNKVKQAWIDSVLSRAEADAGLVELAKESRPEAVERPHEGGPGSPDEDLGAIDPGASVADIFERLERSLLILGASGSGKTTTALELTRALIAGAERDGSQPVPVVLNLSSWSRGSRTLMSWITAELAGKYHVPERISRPWLERDRLVLVLDGLDEVAAELREACVDALNRFGKEYGAGGLLVTSRQEEYEALSVRLRANGAIYLRPLGPEQVEAYLEKAGERAEGLRAVLERDEMLQELARSPLMLSVMSRAYRDRPAEELEADDSAAAEGRSAHLFRTYVERAFVEHEGGRPYSRDATTSWLCWLASRMSQRSQTLFQIEDLQPDWLATRAHLRAYLLAFAAGLGLVLGGLCIVYRVTPTALPETAAQTATGEAFPAASAAAALPHESPAGPAPGAGKPDDRSAGGPSAAEAVGWIVMCSLFALGIAMTDGARSGAGETEARGWGVALRLIANLTIFIALWAPMVVAKLLLAGSLDEGLRQLWQLEDRAFATSFLIPLAGLMMGTAALSARRSLSRSIRTTESLRLERSAAGRGALWGLVAGSVFTAIGYLLVRHVATTFWLLAGSAFGAVLAGFRPRLVRGKAVPNQGMRLTIRSSLRAGLMAVPLAAIAPAACLVLVAAGEGFYGQPYLLAQWTISMLVFVFVCLALWFGALDVGKHYILRAVIGATRQGPWDFRRLLNYASRLNLTQKVGGGYLFLNRQLQDHFAAMSLPPPEAEEVSPRERPDAGSIPAKVAVGALALIGAAALYGGLVTKSEPATLVGAALLGLGALWLIIHTAVRTALRAARREEDEG